MTKFKVGDKVRILNASEIIGGDEHWNDGDIVKVTKMDGVVWLERSKTQPTVRHPFLHRSEHPYVELVSDKPTKNQRITALESEVAELKAKVEALEKAQLSGPGTVYLHGKPIGKIDAIAALSKSPNEQRKAIIAEAKAYLDECKQGLSLNRGRGYVVPFKDGRNRDEGYICDLEYVVNAEKRTVVALLRWTTEWESEIKAKAIAKCAPDDVFNADIGKAITLGRALGLDVSRFEQAVKPTEVVVGHVVADGSDDVIYNVVPEFSMDGGVLSVDFCRQINRRLAIIDDSEAVY